MASHCLQNKSNTIILAYNALHCMLPPYISILIPFLSVCLSLSLFLSLCLCCLYLLHYLQFPHRPLPFYSPNLLNALSTALIPSISLVGVLWLFVKEDQPTLFMIPFTSSELGSQVSLRVEVAGQENLCRGEIYPKMPHWWALCSLLGPPQVN